MTSANPSCPPPLVDPRITRSLGADYEALKNDLEQATEFAGDLQKELAGNKNDLAHFKRLFERTSEDLERMQTSIGALRQERHGLANEVMKARASEAKMMLAMQGHEALRLQEEEARATIEKRDVQIAELTMQVMMLKNTFRHSQERRAEEIAAKNFEADYIARLGI